MRPLSANNSSVTVKVERVDMDVYRVVVDGEIVGFALKLANGFWRPGDRDFNLLAKKSFETPRLVAEWFMGDGAVVSAEPSPAR